MKVPSWQRVWSSRVVSPLSPKETRASRFIPVNKFHITPLIISPPSNWRTRGLQLTGRPSENDVFCSLTGDLLLITSDVCFFPFKDYPRNNWHRSRETVTVNVLPQSDPMKTSKKTYERMKIDAQFRNKKKKKRLGFLFGLLCAPNILISCLKLCLKLPIKSVKWNICNNIYAISIIQLHCWTGNYST